jgi:hypothetical protein
MAKPRLAQLRTLAALLAIGSSALSAQQPDSARRDTVSLIPAVLIGHVADSTGSGVAGAEIMLVTNERVRVVTGDSGEFRITGLPPGTNVFNVRRIGFQPASFTAVLKPGKTHRATFTLSGSAQALPTVAVSDTATQSHWLDQFKRRQSTSRGVFIDRKEIERKNARTGTDIVRTVPGIRLVALRGAVGNQVVMTRGAGARPCIPSMYVHGMPYSGMLDDFTADDIEALEIYVGISEIPPEFDKVGRGICGVIVVWTRDPNKKP